MQLPDDPQLAPIDDLVPLVPERPITLAPLEHYESVEVVADEETAVYQLLAWEKPKPAVRRAPPKPPPLLKPMVWLDTLLAALAIGTVGVCFVSKQHVLMFVFVATLGAMVAFPLSVWLRWETAEQRRFRKPLDWSEIDYRG